MRGFAMAIDRPGEFSIGGTLGIVVFGGMLGAVAGLACVLLRRAVPGPWPVPGLILGLAATIFLVVPSLGGPGQEGSEDPLATRGLFTVVAVGGSLLQAWTADRVRRRFAAGSWTEDGWPAVGLLVSAGVLLVLATLVVSNLAGAVVRAL